MCVSRSWVVQVKSVHQESREQNWSCSLGESDGVIPCPVKQTDTSQLWTSVRSWMWKWHYLEMQHEQQIVKNAVGWLHGSQRKHIWAFTLPGCSLCMSGWWKVTGDIKMCISPAVSDDGPCIWWIAGLYPPQECQEGRWVLGHAMIRPRCELELTNFTLFTRTIL